MRSRAGFSSVFDSGKPCKIAMRLEIRCNEDSLKLDDVGQLHFGNETVFSALDFRNFNSIDSCKEMTGDESNPRYDSTLRIELRASRA